MWGSHPCAIPVISLARFTPAILFFSLFWFSYLAIEFIVLVIVIFYCLPGKQANFCTSESSKTPRYPLPFWPLSLLPLKCKVSAAVEVEVGVGVVRYQFGSTFKAPSATDSALLSCCGRNMRFGYCKGWHGAEGGAVWGTCKTMINAALLLAIFHLKRVKEAANYPTIQRSDRGTPPSVSLARPGRPFTRLHCTALAYLILDAFISRPSAFGIFGSFGSAVWIYDVISIIWHNLFSVRASCGMQRGSSLQRAACVCSNNKSTLSISLPLLLPFPLCPSLSLSGCVEHCGHNL